MASAATVGPTCIRSIGHKRQLWTSDWIHRLWHACLTVLDLHRATNSHGFCTYTMQKLTAVPPWPKLLVWWSSLHCSCATDSSPARLCCLVNIRLTPRLTCLQSWGLLEPSFVILFTCLQFLFYLLSVELKCHWNPEKASTPKVETFRQLPETCDVTKLEWWKEWAAVLQTRPCKHGACSDIAETPSCTATYSTVDIKALKPAVPVQLVLGFGTKLGLK